MGRKHVIQVYLNDDEFKFIQDCAQHLDKSLAQTLLHFADFQNRMRVYKDTAEPVGIKINGINFTNAPFEDSEEY